MEHKKRKYRFGSAAEVRNRQMEADAAKELGSGEDAIKRLRAEIAAKIAKLPIAETGSG